MRSIAPTAASSPYVVVRVHRPWPAGPVPPCTNPWRWLCPRQFRHGRRTFDRLCPELGIVGVSVEYRLAPEHPYPAAIDDCEAGLRWTFTHAEELGIDPDRVGITGVSAGGGLCAALGLRARDAGLPVRFQLLDCPMLDDRLTSASSQFEDLVIWSRTSNQVALPRWPCGRRDPGRCCTSSPRSSTWPAELCVRWRCGWLSGRGHDLPSAHGSGVETNPVYPGTARCPAAGR